MIVPETGSTQTRRSSTALTPGTFSAATRSASRSFSSRMTPSRPTTPSVTVIAKPSRGTQETFASSARMRSRISSSPATATGCTSSERASARSRSARLTMPTGVSPSSTGTRLMRRRSISATISSSGVSGVTLTRSRVMISSTLRPWVRTYSPAKRPGPIRISSQRGRCRSVPVSLRRKRSPSVRIPTSLPAASITGRPLI